MFGDMQPTGYDVFSIACLQTTLLNALQAFPGHCDCLALANIQASLLNIADANPLHHCDGYPDVKPRLADIRATSLSGDKSETIPCDL